MQKKMELNSIVLETIATLVPFDKLSLLLVAPDGKVGHDLGYP